MADNSVEDSTVFRNLSLHQEENLLELLEKAHALTHIALQQDMTTYSAKTVYHYLWVLSDLIEAIDETYRASLSGAS